MIWALIKSNQWKWRWNVDRVILIVRRGGDWHFQTWPDPRRGWRQLAVDVANTWTFYFPQRENVQATTKFCLSSSADREATWLVCYGHGWGTNKKISGSRWGDISYSHVSRPLPYSPASHATWLGALCFFFFLFVNHVDWENEVWTNNLLLWRIKLMLFYC